MFKLLQFADKVAVITEQGVTLTYSQLYDEVSKIRPYLKKHKLICCLCKNEIGALLGYITGICNENPLVMLDGGRNTNYVHSYVNKYLPEYIWGPSSICMNFNGSVIFEKYGYSLLKLPYSETTGMTSINEKLSLCLTTSGSTGSPKLVRLSQNNLNSNAKAIASYLKISDKERPITTMPLYYSFGLSVINSHLIKGATILLTDSSIFSKHFWIFFQQTSPTSIAGVPFTYEMLERMGFFHMNLPSLKTMIQAGGKLNADIIQKYVKFASETNKEFIVMYGQTEASPRMSYLPFKYAKERPSSIGIPIPGGDFFLYNSDNRLISEFNVEGELIYKGPNVCMGYAESREDLGKGDENKGILRTGDIAYMDSEGFYYITGRLKRFVKIWGNRYNLDTIEQLIKPITSDCACVGNDKKIYVIVENAKYIERIKQLMVTKLKLDKSCFSIIVMEKIPKTPSGKIQYAELKSIIGI